MDESSVLNNEQALDNLKNFLVEKNAKLDEDKRAQLAKKPYAIVTAKDPYEDLQFEDDFIKFLLERVIIMRELPYMRAANSLEKN